MTASDHWKRETFYVAIDEVSSGIGQRFKKSQPLLEAFSLFAPSRFPHLLLQYKTSCDLHKALEDFCQIFKLNCYRCADELFSDFTTFKNFTLVLQDKGDADIEMMIIMMMTMMVMMIIMLMMIRNTEE